MTDNGHAALMETLKPYEMPDPWTEGLRTVVMAGTAEEVSAIVLANGAVFLPDGLGPVMVGMAKEIAALRDALDAHHRGLTLAGDGPDKCAICAALAAAKGTL